MRAPLGSVIPTTVDRDKIEDKIRELFDQKLGADDYFGDFRLLNFLTQIPRI